MDSTQRVNERAIAPFGLGRRDDEARRLDEPFVEEAFRVLWLIAEEDETVAEPSQD